MSNLSERKSVNERMKGKCVKVIDEEGDWIGEIIEIKDVDTFIIKGEHFTKEVDIFSIRSIE